MQNNYGLRGRPYMYGGVNLPRHAKSKREVSKKGICQRDAKYARNITCYKENFNERKRFRFSLLNSLVKRVKL